MVSSKFDDSNPMAGRDDDTPYDYDHILPYDHWGTLSRKGEGTRFKDCFDSKDDKVQILGDSIGNVRVWPSIDNRSDGAGEPTEKLKLKDSTGLRTKLLEESLIPEDQIDFWLESSSSTGDPRHWERPRALAFQRAVEKRTFYLYKTFYEALSFSEWEPFRSEM
jgi:hypothetical protein